jgi:TctA family transporter
MYLGNVAGLLVVLSTVPLFAAIMRVPFALIAPVILMVCAIGAFTVANSNFDIWLMLIFGIVGYVMKKLDYPLAPMVLALVLGDRAEDAFRQALIGSAGDLSVFFDNPLVTTLMALSFALLLWGPISNGVSQIFRRSAVAAKAEQPL